MSRRKSRSWKPTVEAVEPRQLLSLVTNILMSKQQDAALAARARAAAAHPAYFGPGPGFSAAPNFGNATGFVPSRSSIALPENQGPQGINLLLQPQGEMSPHQYRQSLFQASFIGPYTIGPGRFDSEAMQVSVRGVGRTTHMLHADIQIGAIVAKDPSIQNSGASVIFDRNIDTDSALGFNFGSPSTDVDAHGRPNRFTTVTLDDNTSGGAYVEGYAQGVMEIRYVPSGRRTPRGFEQGTAYVKIQGQVYAPRIASIERNAGLNP